MTIYIGPAARSTRPYTVDFDINILKVKVDTPAIAVADGGFYYRFQLYRVRLIKGNVDGLVAKVQPIFAPFGEEEWP